MNNRLPILLNLYLLASLATPLSAVEYVKFRDDDQVVEASGRVLASDSAGSLFLQTDEGVLHLVMGDTVIERSSDDTPFKPVTAKEMGKRLLADLPDGFQIYTTPHYVVAYETSRDFAKWVSSMLERLHRAFTNYWSRQGFELSEPEFPLPVLVYASVDSYKRAAFKDLRTATSTVVGYYSIKTNRVSMYDLTGVENSRGGGRRRSSLKQINQLLSVPAAVPLVSTVVHEATHQIAYNCGLQQRFADLPLWLVEGMAVYFEAPDLSSGRGWRGIGKVNYPRLRTFRRNIRNWGPGSLAAMVTTDKRLRSTRTAADAYADAWALNYFLIKQRPEEYTKYMQLLSKKPQLEQTTPEERLAEFREHFGDLEQLQRDFLDAMSKVD